jgi:hypothetical protein
MPSRQCPDSEVRTILLPSPFLRTSEPKDTSAADLKSLTHSRQNRLQGLQIESGTRIMDLLVPMTFRSPRKDVAAT